MEDRFKRYLEREFRAIAPTRAAMDYRKRMLRQMMAKAQDLKIKGVTDEELIYDMVIDGLGDFRATLVEFENKTVKTNQTKHKALIAAICAVGYVLLLTCAYLVTSFALETHWGETWLIMVGGLFAGIIGGSIFGAVKCYSKKKVLISRFFIALSIVLASVFVFLFMQILFNLPLSWLVFLVMVILLLAVDTIIADATGSKTRYIELAIFIETFCALLYVILGITLDTYGSLQIWHPGWVLCLAGAVGIVIEFVVLAVKKYKKSDDSEKKKIKSEYVETDEDFYTKWD